MRIKNLYIVLRYECHNRDHIQTIINPSRYTYRIEPTAGHEQLRQALSGPRRGNGLEILEDEDSVPKGSNGRCPSAMENPPVGPGKPPTHQLHEFITDLIYLMT